jgi:hypothetical protein
LLLPIAMLTAPMVHAQTRILQLADGVATGTDTLRQLTLQANYRQQDNAAQTAIRIALPPTFDTFVFFADASVVEGELDDVAINGDVEVSGGGEGAGFYYTGLPDWQNFNQLLRFSVRREEIEQDSTIAVAAQQADLDYSQRSTSLAWIASPSQPPFANGANYYLALGASYHRIRDTLRVDGTIEPLLSEADEILSPYAGAGIVVPWYRLRLFAAVEYEEDIALSVGVRFNLSRDAKE